MVVAATPTTIRSQSNPKRPPLLPSERENNVVPHRRPKSREVNSRYLSTTTTTSSSTTTTSGSSSSSTTLSNSSFFSPSRRCTSPIPSTRGPLKTPSLNSTTVKRSQSAERRRPATPRPSTSTGRLRGVEMSAAAKLLVSSTSTRSLSVSFQGESFAMPVNNNKMAKPAPSPMPMPVRKGTPERKRTPSPMPMPTPTPTPRSVSKGENVRRPLLEHQPWPGRSRPVVSSSLSRSVDLGCGGKKQLISGSAKVVRALQESLKIDNNSNRASCDDKLLRTSTRSVHRDELVKGIRDCGEGSCVNGSSLGSESLASETESVSSECNSGSQDSNTTSGAARGKGGGRSIVVPGRFWQEANNRMNRASEPGSPMARSNALKGMVPPKLVAPKKFVTDSPVASPRGTLNNRGLVSPLRGSVGPASPSRLRSTLVAPEKCSPSRGMASPSRVRTGTACVLPNSVNSMPSILSYGADVRRVKVADNRLGDTHLLRILHNRQLQWRFVNARAETSMSSQKTIAERGLYNAWRKTSDLRGVVSSRRKELQWLRQKLKLVSVLKGQMLYLEEWGLMDKDHCSSLSGATESLKASIIRLPVVGGARADIQDMKDVICSAADVMHAMASSICSLLSRVEEARELMAEVACLTSKEHALLNECKEILSRLATLQVKDCSLRAHMLQLKSVPSSLTVEV